MKYSLVSFLMNSEIHIPDYLQENAVYPFTMQCAMRFFNHFENESFNFDGVVKSMNIYDAKENLPRHSYAHGWLYSQSLDDITQTGVFPEFIGTIHFEYGGNLSSPIIRVEKR